jgi:hypothetical protein
LLQPLKKNGKEIVSIHVRRADYIENGVNTPNGTLPYFNPSTKYYEEAVSLFSEKNCTFIVFSDDIPWCKSAFKAREDFVFSEGESPEVDLCAMSLCDHNIITNSSFSFLGAVLNKNPSRKVICPGKYMKHDNVIKHVNHCWFPDDYTPLVVE